MRDALWGAALIKSKLLRLLAQHSAARDSNYYSVSKKPDRYN